jgi:hypothetical protein
MKFFEKYFRNTESEMHVEVSERIITNDFVDFRSTIKMSSSATLVFNKFCRSQFTAVGTRLDGVKPQDSIRIPFHILGDPMDPELEIVVVYRADPDDTVMHVSKILLDYRKMIMAELKNLLDPFKDKESIFRDALENYLAIAQLTHESNPENPKP